MNVIVWLLLCSSVAEMQKWMEDIRVAIEMAKTTNGLSSDLLTSSLTGNSKSENRWRLLAVVFTVFREVEDRQTIK